MTFRFLEEILNLNFDLKILRRTSQRHSILLYQHTGTLEASDQRIGNLINSYNEFIAFFEKARDLNSDLILCPEYSCSWENIQDIINNPNHQPRLEKLWVLGAESITKEQLVTFKNSNKDDALIHFEDGVLGKDLRYLDPLVYVFKSVINGSEKLVIIIQFKTHHMGVWGGGIVERNNLIEGNTIYILRNHGGDSIYLFSLVCSEAMNFSHHLDHNVRMQIDWVDKPFLILNPQLNPNPSHSHFAAFRKFIFSFPNKEIISVNWNKDSHIGNQSLLEFGTARSAFFIQSDEIDHFNLHRIRANHAKGMYYFYYGIKNHAFILNSTVQLFDIEAPPVSINNVHQVQARRDGPELRNTFSYNGNNFEVNQNLANDGLLDYLGGIHCQNVFLLAPDKCILDKERLVCLTTGKIKNKGDSFWFNLKNLFSITLDDTTEYNLRITFIEETNAESITQRTIFLDTINELDNSILQNHALYPESIDDLKNDHLCIGFSGDSALDHYKYNIVTTTGQKKIATICYLQGAPDSTIEKTFETLQNMFSNDNKNKCRVVVFYKRGLGIHARWDRTAAKISITEDYPSQSFLKDSK